jgi:hypothetical protein
MYNFIYCGNDYRITYVQFINPLSFLLPLDSICVVDGCRYLMGCVDSEVNEEILKEVDFRRGTT